MGLRGLAYGAYERRLVARLDHERVPHHVRDFLGWCEEAGVEVVTLWLLSTDNLTRAPEDLQPLLRIIEQTVSDLAAEKRWRIHPVGAADLLPDETRDALKAAENSTADVDGLLVNIAVGYGGRREITDAVRSLLVEH